METVPSRLGGLYQFAVDGIKRLDYFRRIPEDRSPIKKEDHA